MKTFPLQITSIELYGRQCGATVGHFHGELKYIQRVSKYLKTLDFKAEIVSKKRFVDFRRWILKQKHLTNLCFVPDYFPVKREYDVQDWDQFSTKGVASLIRPLVQPKQLTLFGFAQKNLIMKKLIASHKNPLNVNVEAEYRWRHRKTSEWFKKIFANLPSNIQVTYSIESIQYFLSMPQGTEKLPVGDDCDDDNDDDSENEDEDNAGDEDGTEEGEDYSGRDGSSPDNNAHENDDEVEEEEEKKDSDEDEDE